MSFLNEYAVSIIVVSVLAILLENLLPAGNNKKYVNVMIGLLVMLVILTPLTRLPHYNETFILPELRLDDTDLSLSPKPYVAESFEKKLALAISEDLHSRFGVATSCRVSCHINEEGQITGIRHIQLAPYTPEMGTYIAANYGFKEEIITP